MLWPLTIHDPTLCGPGEEDSWHWWDAQLKLPGTEEAFKGCRLSLASASTYFEELLSEPRDSYVVSPKDASIAGEDLRRLLDYVHGRPVAVSDMRQFVRLMEACELTDTRPLRDDLEAVVRRDFSADDVLCMLAHLGEEGSSHTLIRLGVGYAARNFSEVRKGRLGSALGSLPPSLLHGILSHDRLDVREELEAWEWARDRVRSDAFAAGSELVLEAVRFGLIPARDFEEKVRTEPFVAVREHRRKCPAWWECALALQRSGWRRRRVLRGGGQQQLAWASRLLRPRIPNGLVVGVHLERGAPSHLLRVSVFDPGARRFGGSVLTASMPHNMAVEATTPSPFDPMEIVVLQRYFRRPRSYHTVRLNIRTGENLPVPSFSSPGEKILAVAKGKLFALSLNPGQLSFDVLDLKKNLWTALCQKDMPALVLGITAVCALDTIYVIGGHLNESSEVQAFDDEGTTLRTIGSLLTGRIDAVACQWSDGFVVAGGIQQLPLRSHIPIEYFDVKSRSPTKLADIPIPLHRGYNITQCEQTLLVMTSAPMQGKNLTFQYMTEEDSWLPLAITNAETLRIKALTRLDLHNVENYKPFFTVKPLLPHAQLKPIQSKKKRSVRLQPRSLIAFSLTPILILFQLLYGFSYK